LRDVKMICRLIVVACAVAILITVVFADGEKYTLKEQYAEGDIRTVDTQAEKALEIKLIAGKREGKIPIKYKGVDKYVEKVLTVDKDGKPTKVARYYEKSTTETEKAEGSPVSESTAFEDNTYIIEKTKDGVKVERLDGEEVPDARQKELATAIKGSRNKVLPEEEVEVGDTWDVPLEAIREIYSINQKIEGTAKATFSGVEKYGDYKAAVVKVEVEISYKEGSATLKYKGRGKVYFALEEKKIVGVDFTAKIEVSGSQKSGEEGETEIKFGGGGNCVSRYKAKLNEGEIDLTPPKVEKKDEEKKEEKKEDSKQEKKKKPAEENNDK
jgi:hypothetical protein